MDTRRWWDEVAVFLALGLLLVLAMLIGYRAAPNAPPARYKVGAWADSDQYWHRLYRYDTHTGKTWKSYISRANYSAVWIEIPEPNQVVPPPNEE